MWSCVCPICNMTACKLMESAIMGLPCHYSICPSHLKYQMKKFWLKASVVYEQLISNVPCATICPIRNGMLCSLYNDSFINYFGQKLTFFFKFIKFQPQKLFFRDFSLSANLV